jgi:hypothetical protein
LKQVIGFLMPVLMCTPTRCAESAAKTHSSGYYVKQVMKVSTPMVMCTPTRRAQSAGHMHGSSLMFVASHWILNTYGDVHTQHVARCRAHTQHHWLDVCSKSENIDGQRANSWTFTTYGVTYDSTISNSKRCV